MRKNILLGYGCVFGAYTVITGALLIWQVLSVYFAGTAPDYAGVQIFSRANVGAALKRISPALWLWLALAVVGFGVGIAFSTAQRVAGQDVRYTLYRLKKRTPAAGKTNADGELGKAAMCVRREENIIKILWLCCGAVALAGAIYGIVYLCIPSHFPKEDVTAEMLKMVKHFIPWVTWTFMFACCIGVYERVSAKKQIPAVKTLSAACKSGELQGTEKQSWAQRTGAELAVKARNSRFYNVVYKIFDFVYNHRLLIVRCAVGCFSVAFIIAGAFNGSARDVLIKAVNICTECIGLG